MTKGEISFLILIILGFPVVLLSDYWFVRVLPLQAGLIALIWTVINHD